MKIIAFLLLLIPLSACQKEVPPPPPPPEPVAEVIEIISIDPQVDLEETYWQLNSVAGEKVKMADHQAKEAFMQLMAKKKQVRGFSSCNIFSGAYETTENDLTFGSTLSTKMSCKNTMATEQGFFQVLTETAHYTINSKTLNLYSADKKIIATLEPMEPN